MSAAGHVDDEPPDADPVHLPIDGTLDLHAFRAEEVRDLLGDWIEECLRRGIREVRIVHGKGRGVLKRVVRAELARHPAVRRVRDGGEGAGGWGATLADLEGPGTDPSKSD